MSYSKEIMSYPKNIIVHRQCWDGYDTYYIMDHLGRGMIRIFNYLVRHDDEAQFELTDFYVDPNYRRSGIGTRLMKEALAYCEALCDFDSEDHRGGKIAIEVKPQLSEPFVGEWYERLGFKKVGLGFCLDSPSDEIILYEKEISISINIDLLEYE